MQKHLYALWLQSIEQSTAAHRSIGHGISNTTIGHKPSVDNNDRFTAHRLCEQVSTVRQRRQFQCTVCKNDANGYPAAAAAICGKRSAHQSWQKASGRDAQQRQANRNGSD